MQIYIYINAKIKGNWKEKDLEVELEKTSHSSAHTLLCLNCPPSLPRVQTLKVAIYHSTQTIKFIVLLNR